MNMTVVSHLRRYDSLAREDNSGMRCDGMNMTVVSLLRWYDSLAREDNSGMSYNGLDG